MGAGLGGEKCLQKGKKGNIGGRERGREEKRKAEWIGGIILT